MSATRWHYSATRPQAPSHWSQPPHQPAACSDYYYLRAFAWKKNFKTACGAPENCRNCLKSHSRDTDARTPPPHWSLYSPRSAFFRGYCCNMLHFHYYCSDWCHYYSTRHTDNHLATSFLRKKYSFIAIWSSSREILILYYLNNDKNNQFIRQVAKLII